MTSLLLFPVFSGAVTPTTITISGSVPSSSAVTRFMVEWQRDTSVGCSDVNQGTMSVTGPTSNLYKYKKSFLLNEGGYRDGKL